MRFSMTEGQRSRPQRLVVYGSEGIGKSTLASQMPDPVFIDVEDGTDQLNVVRLERPGTWKMLLDEVWFVADEVGAASTVVIDTADAAEKLCQTHVCQKAKKDSIEAWSYGKGYVIAKEEFKSLLDALDHCVSKGLNVVVICHSLMRKFERPDETGAYDRFELKLNKHVSAMVKEWADALLFLDYETFVSVDDAGRAKASGGRRIIRTDHSPVWDAKNRWGLPSTIALDADGIAAIRSHLPVRGDAPSAARVPTMPEPTDTANMGVAELKAQRDRRDAMPPYMGGLLRLMAESDVSVEELEAAMVARGKRETGQRMEAWEQPFAQWLEDQWQGVMSIISKAREARAAASDEKVPF